MFQNYISKNYREMGRYFKSSTDFEGEGSILCHIVYKYLLNK